jgi:RNA-directed DNA polymerase
VTIQTGLVEDDQVVDALAPNRTNHAFDVGSLPRRTWWLLKLIRAFLNGGVMENGLVSPSVEGTPQGGPFSPLLGNIVLDELDRELERRGATEIDAINNYC